MSQDERCPTSRPPPSAGPTDPGPTQQNELRYDYENIIGRSPQMQEIFRRLDRLTNTIVPVFIHGESGTGKELVAKAIHDNGTRKGWYPVNCAAVAETLLESELFGSTKGAFSGANTEREGLFKRADNGTVFLDEVGDMTPAMQGKLLRVLENGTIQRVGELGKDHKVDVRIISASNKDLKKLVEQGKFRKDLYYRLNVVKVELPPLRERKEDVPLLIDHFMKGDGASKATKEFDTEATQMLNRYDWPGNIRELKNVVQRAILESDEDTDTIGKDAIVFDDDAAEVRREAGGPSRPSDGNESNALFHSICDALTEFELFFNGHDSSEAGPTQKAALKSFKEGHNGLAKKLADATLGHYSIALPLPGLAAFLGVYVQVLRKRLGDAELNEETIKKFGVASAFWRNKKNPCKLTALQKEVLRSLGPPNKEHGEP